MTRPKVVGIGQPTYLPWLGFLDAMDQVDEFVVLDHVQFSRHSWQHRNRIKGPNGEIMLTVPVRKTGLDTTIVDAQLSERATLGKHATTLRQAYARASHRHPVLDQLEAIYADAHDRLLALNLALLDVLRDAFGVTTPLVRSSTLEVDGTKDELVRAICDARGATTYLSAPGSRTYMEAGSAFSDGGVQVQYHAYQCVAYPQLYGDFLPYLSAVDAALNTGPNARATMLAGRGLTRF